ncbi:MAG: winged helix-turn-helix transcriptional regulator [Clostridiales bacterium]|nr:winged helix-turn-helix transcriptional regulator [Clostridiales bacterium]
MKHQKSLMRAVGKARRAWQQHVREVAQGMGIPDSYREVIMYLYHNPGAGQKQIAAFAQITASAVNQAVKSMEAEGYLRKETDPADKRNTCLYLTEKSEAIARELKHRLEISDGGITALVGPEKEAEMIALLETVADYIRKELTSC